MGWKEIGEHLRISVRTVQRWERELGLPVHRVPGSSGHSVFAVADEIDRWLEAGAPRAGAPQEAVPERRRLAGLAALAAMLLAGAGLLLARSLRPAWFQHESGVTALPHPEISFTSPISPQPAQTIVIKGHGLGVQTSFTNQDTPFLAIRDTSARWAAGRIIPWNWDEVTLNVASWTDSEIVITGFSGAYGKKGWTLHAGDRIEVAVWNPQSERGPALYHLTVNAPALASRR